MSKGTANTMLLNYTKSGQPFVHKLVGNVSPMGIVVQGHEIKDPELRNAFMRERRPSMSTACNPDALGYISAICLLGTMAAFALQTSVAGQATTSGPIEMFGLEMSVARSSEELLPTGPFPLVLSMLLGSLVALLPGSYQLSDDREMPTVLAVTLVGLVAAFGQDAVDADAPPLALIKMLAPAAAVVAALLIPCVEPPPVHTRGSRRVTLSFCEHPSTAPPPFKRPFSAQSPSSFQSPSTPSSSSQLKPVDGPRSPRRNLVFLGLDATISGEAWAASARSYFHLRAKYTNSRVTEQVPRLATALHGHRISAPSRPPARSRAPLPRPTVRRHLPVGGLRHLHRAPPPALSAARCTGGRRAQVAVRLHSD